jgi:hypothetical protein
MKSHHIFVGVTMFFVSTMALGYGQDISSSIPPIKLVELLSSENDRPIGRRIDLNKYRVRSQATVALAAIQIAQSGDSSIDVLMEIPRDDARYSLTVLTPSGQVHMSVADVASWILQRMIRLECYIEESWLLHRLGKTMDIREQVLSSPSKRLKDLQLEQIEYWLDLSTTSEYRAGIKFNQHTGSPELSPNDFSTKRDTLIAQLKKLKRQLLETEAAVPITTLDTKFAKVWGVPWNPQEPPW